MQKLTYLLYQLDEARRYIIGGRLEQLRLALLLLDNAAEIQLDRRTRQEMVLEDLRERLRESTIAWAKAGVGTAPDPDEDWNPLSKKQKRELSRLFDAKLEFLSVRHPLIDLRLVRVLSYLHRYRNEAYHEASVRRETIRTAATVLLDVNCQLLESIFRVTMVASDEDYSWVQERFGIGNLGFFRDDVSASVIRQLREDVVPDAAVVASNLTDHLLSRVYDLVESLDFIVENTRIESRQEALTIAQLQAAIERGEVVPETRPESFDPAWKLERIEALTENAHAIRDSDERLEAFERFSELESALEPLEREVGELAAFVDGMIQDSIDRARGK